MIEQHFILSRKASRQCFEAMMQEAGFSVSQKFKNYYVIDGYTAMTEEQQQAADVAAYEAYRTALTK